jgi:hypothetical protein
MKAALVLPNEERVRSACRKFDDDNSVVEHALRDLFSQYPLNDTHSHVLLKVVALNRLYATQILAVHDVACHIYDQAQDIDAGLAIGSTEIVDRITRVTIRSTGKEVNFYSFASKYCSWHNHDKYPIWDSRVRRYLCSLRRSLKNTSLAGLLGTNPDLWNHYSEFVTIMHSFRDHFKLGAFTFKEIDKFIWSSAGEPDPDEPRNALRAGSGDT